MNAALPPATIGRLVTSVGTVFVDKLAAFAVHPSAASADSALHQRIPSLVAISAAATIL
jgi:hypothetical protein